MVNSRFPHAAEGLGVRGFPGIPRGKTGTSSVNQSFSKPLEF
jgi:hypothetical protein